MAYVSSNQVHTLYILGLYMEKLTLILYGYTKFSNIDFKRTFLCICYVCCKSYLIRSYQHGYIYIRTFVRIWYVGHCIYECTINVHNLDVDVHLYVI